MSELATLEHEPLTLDFLAKNRKAQVDVSHLSAPLVSAGIEQTNINHYRTKNTGHGYAAEDANALNDVLQGRKVELTGKTRELNGADRIVDGVKIQTKYCQSAQESINSAFDKGRYRYPDQVIEVPKDQYEQAIELMRKRIQDGQVPGVTDPARAQELVKEGSITYRQAVNIAKAGNVDSILFDIKSRAVSTTFAFSLSFAITFVTLKAQGVDSKVALRSSLVVGLKVGGISLLSGVLTAQLLRTRLIGGVGKVVAKNAIDAMFKTQLGKRFIIQYASAMNGQAMKGLAARNYAAKALRSNVVSGTVVTVLMTSPDIYRAAFSKNVSWAQVSKNLVVNASGVAGGLAGAAGGAALGSIIPGVGTAVGAAVGGALGGLGIGLGASALSKALMDYIVVDDAKQMVDMLPDLLEPLVNDYLLTEDEVIIFSKSLCEKIKPAFLRDMYKAQEKEAFVYEAFEPLCESLVKQRPHAHLPSLEDILKAEEEFVTELQQFEKQEAIGTLILTLRAAANLPELPAVEPEYGSVVSDEHRSMIKASKWYRFGF
ncbi:hypothetical protein IAE37_000877 [Pseudomonas sp. S31]|uniref:hypothetical protein n=1 Tax=Pseudomonas sp. S31 TaxID=1564473 RepID=UPI0019122BB1|nr:hypothetical protein [Pseudomonas sp. S31]MBK4998601.1 hypothetical protein [Pseudomonas sp. S31]